MSSYGSNTSGYLHTQYQQPHQAPPYPTTPGHPSSSSQGYFPPMPQQQQQQQMYSSSPTYTHNTMPRHHQQQQQQQQNIGRTRTYSTSSATYPTQPPQPQPMQHHQPASSSAIPIRQPNAQNFQYPASYPASYPPPAGYAQYAPVHRRSTSEYSTSPHDDSGSDNKHFGRHEEYPGELDSDTEREYQRRYAKERRMERRPTLGGSLLSMLDTVGKAIGSSGRH